MFSSCREFRGQEITKLAIHALIYSFETLGEFNLSIIAITEDRKKPDLNMV